MTTDAPHASISTVRAARLAAQGLDGGFDSPAAAVDRLVCLQAQDLAAAKWVLGSRVAGATEATIDAAIDERVLLRSWPMRGTLHFVAPEMLRPILRLTAARLMQRAAKTHRDEGIDDEVHAVARRVAVHELEGGRAATRDELQAAWAAAGIDTAGQRGYHLIWRLANEGLLCCGPVETRARQRFVLLDEWSPRRSDEPRDTDEILGRLFAGYARGHGPVTVRDFAWWTGLTLTQARVALAAAGGAVVPFDAERFVAADAPSTASAPSGHHVLAPFDEYFLGYGDRTAFCSEADALRVVPGKNGLFLPILVAGGEVVGTWRRAPVRKGTTSIEVTRFRGRPAVSRFRPAFQRWAAFWSTELGEITTA
ncbi:winged helix DNA-binding domain-containing protein [Agromyces sp. NPDC056965]|uniref:winged helix DNA-binding domain-containing protein n=1 Tax=Agromyces sp. NPDC056965 TaxID=3345983 RepID=UPI00364159DB